MNDEIITIYKGNPITELIEEMMRNHDKIIMFQLCRAYNEGKNFEKLQQEKEVLINKYNLLTKS